MDDAPRRTLRILIIFAVIALTGIDLLPTHPELWWLYGVLVAVVFAILLIQELKTRKKQKEPMLNAKQA